MQKINKKTLLLTNIISPYRIPVYNYLSNKIENFEVWFLSGKEKNRDWIIEEEINFKYKLLNSKKFELIKGHFTLHIKFISKILREYNPDIILVTGYDAPAYWQALYYAKKNKKKIVLWNGSTLLFSKFKKGIAYKIKKRFLSKIDFFITYGSKATEYIKYFGIDENKIITGCNTVDIEWFYSNLELIKKDPRFKEFFIKYKNKIKLLFVGRLIKYKGLEKLLNIIAKFNNPSIHLFVLGDGHDKEYLMNYSKNIGINNFVEFLGYIQKKDMPFYYSLSDYFIFPTFLDPWGLVVNEALACGVPVLSSIYAGATYDLIKEGINGFAFDPKDEDGFLIKMKRIINYKFDKRDIQKTIMDKDPKEYGDKIIKALNMVWFDR